MSDYIYQTYTGQNGWVTVSKEEYEHTKDKYEHRRLKNCQTGYADICAAGSRDGVACPAESCDIDDGIRRGLTVSDELLVELFYAAQGNITQFRIKARKLLGG